MKAKGLEGKFNVTRDPRTAWSILDSGFKLSSWMREITKILSVKGFKLYGFLILP